MKIWELIQKLEEYDEDVEVFIKARWTEKAEIIEDNTFLNGSIIIF